MANLANHCAWNACTFSWSLHSNSKTCLGPSYSPICLRWTVSAPQQHIGGLLLARTEIWEYTEPAWNYHITSNNLQLYVMPFDTLFSVCCKTASSNCHKSVMSSDMTVRSHAIGILENSVTLLASFATASSSDSANLNCHKSVMSGDMTVCSHTIGILENSVTLLASFAIFLFYS